MAEKIDRKELRRPDEFQQVAGKAMDWIVAHQRKVLLVLAVIAASAIVAWGTSTWKARRDARGGAALAAALALEQRPVAGEGAPVPGEETFPSRDERRKAVLAALEKVRTEHGGTHAATTARAQIGFQKLHAGDPAGAQKDLQDFAAHASKDHPLQAFAAESLGYAFEAQGKLEEAKGAFARLSDAGMPERAAYQAARIALVEGKPDAKAQLEQVAKDYPKDPVAMEANQRLEIAALPKVDASAPPPQAKPAPVPPAKKAAASAKK